MHFERLQCKMCYQIITTAPAEKSGPWCSEENWEKITKICSTQLFSELVDVSNILSANSESVPLPPFCSQCREEFAKIIGFDSDKDIIQRRIDEFVDIFTVNVVNLRQIKESGVLEGPISINSMVDDVDATQENSDAMDEDSSLVTCKMCHKSYISEKRNEKLEVQVAQKVLNVCETYFFKELIGNDCFDWNCLAFKKFFSFCVDCFDNIKTVCHMNDDIDKIDKNITVSADKYVVSVLKLRKHSKKLGFRKNYINNKQRKIAESSTNFSCSSLNISKACETKRKKEEHSDCGESGIIISNPRSLFIEKNLKVNDNLPKETQARKFLVDEEKLNLESQPDVAAQIPIADVAAQIPITDVASHAKFKKLRCTTNVPVECTIDSQFESDNGDPYTQNVAEIKNVSIPVSTSTALGKSKTDQQQTKSTSKKFNPTQKNIKQDYRCKDCGTSYKQRNHLANHYRQRHKFRLSW